MSLLIELTPEQESRLRERAATRGEDPLDYGRSLIESGLRLPDLKDLLAPIRQDFAASGMAVDELEALIESTRDAVYRNKHAAGRE